MYSIEVSTTFSAAHQLRLPAGILEPLHGHDFHVTLRLSSPTLDSLETVIDFHELHDALAAIIAPFRNQNLNTLEPFLSKWNPSAERIAEHIGRQLLPLLQDLALPPRTLRLIEVRLTEAPHCLAIWSPE